MSNVKFLQLERIKDPNYHYKNQEFEDFKNLMLSKEIPFEEIKEGLIKMADNLSNTNYNELLPPPHKMDEVIKALESVTEEKFETLSFLILATMESYEKRGGVVRYI